jgi:hypothetical protein
VNTQIRAQIVRTLETMIERYPNMRVGQLFDEAVGASQLYYVSDEDLAYALNHLFVTFTQFEAAGLVKKGK